MAAGQDIFGFKDAGFGGIFSADEAKFTVDTIGGEDMLIQNFQLQYQQQFQPIYEFGSSKVWFSRTHAAGTLTIGRIVGAFDLIGHFADKGCSPTAADIEVGNGLCEGNATSKTLHIEGAFLSGVQWSGQAGQAYVTEGCTITFASLS